MIYIRNLNLFLCCITYYNIQIIEQTFYAFLELPNYTLWSVPLVIISLQRTSQLWDLYKSEGQQKIFGSHPLGEA